MTDRDDILRKVMEEEDYIRSPKFANSVSKFLAKNPDGADDTAIARFLSLTEEQVQQIWLEAVEDLKAEMEE